MYWWFVYSMFLNSGNNAAFFLELVKLEYFSLITFYSLDACTTSFLSSAYSGLTRYPKLREEISSLRYSGSTRHGFAFAVGEPSFEVVFWPLFNMALCFLTWSSERKSLKWLQEYIEKFIKLNKQRRWFHSSLEKLPLLIMSESWFSVTTFLIWILDSILILWNNKLRATLWVLDTFLIVGLRSLLSIFDHGFVVFTDVQLKLILRRMCVCGHTIHITQLMNLLSSFDFLALVLKWRVTLGWTLLLVERSTSITISQRPSASNPSLRNPASGENDFRLCRTLRDSGLLLAHPTDRNKCMASKTAHLMLILSPQNRQQSLSPENNPYLRCCAVFPTWQYCSNSHVVHFVTSLANLRCQVVPFVPSTSSSDNSATNSSSSCLNWWLSMEGLETLNNCSTFLFANSQYCSTHFWACPSIS